MQIVIGIQRCSEMQIVIGREDEWVTVVTRTKCIQKFESNRPSCPSKVPAGGIVFLSKFCSSPGEWDFFISPAMRRILSVSRFGLEGGCKYSASCGQIAGPKGLRFGSVLSDYFWIFLDISGCTVPIEETEPSNLFCVLVMKSTVHFIPFYDLFAFIFARLDDQAMSYPDSSAFWGFGCDSDRQDRRTSKVHGVLSFSPSNSQFTNSSSARQLASRQWSGKVRHLPGKLLWIQEKTADNTFKNDCQPRGIGPRSFAGVAELVPHFRCHFTNAALNLSSLISGISGCQNMPKPCQHSVTAADLAHFIPEWCKTKNSKSFKAVDGHCLYFTQGQHWAIQCQHTPYAQ